LLPWDSHEALLVDVLLAFLAAAEDAALDALECRMDVLQLGHVCLVHRAQGIRPRDGADPGLRGPQERTSASEKLLARGRD